ncbi:MULTISPECIES: DUF1289 domain-containing protein [unclassified Endozoicomonas]|uniref:DUF1289 domain-containing protein n=1 Tax=unclassified Endozoicomonas TaxID=2644528 RepID=UPI002148CBAA|nr:MULTISPECIES: DUF1289 domain-containing protein [unclassified Endozoicomonas]
MMSKVKSPCIRQCALNKDQVCTGCFRSRTEIARWSRASQEEQKEIVLNAKVRCKQKTAE